MSETTSKESLPIRALDEQELKQLAMDIVDGKVFTDRHVRKGGEGDMPMIFMPIALGCFQTEDEANLQKIGMLYEYYDKAGPRSMNGYPVFTSLHIFPQVQLELLEQTMRNYEALKNTL